MVLSRESPAELGTPYSASTDFAVSSSMNGLDQAKAPHNPLTVDGEKSRKVLREGLADRPIRFEKRNDTICHMFGLQDRVCTPSFPNDDNCIR